MRTEKISRVGSIALRIGTQYRALPPETRERFEAGLSAAKRTLEETAHLPEALRHDVLSLFYEVILAIVGGTTGKVRLALAEHCPELYFHFAEILDRKAA